MTRDMKLDEMLDTLKAPAPRAELASDILAKAAATPQTTPAANDRGFAWKRMMAAAACLIVIAFAGISYISTPDVSEDAQWEMLAENTGFSELHEWVYADPAQDAAG